MGYRLLADAICPALGQIPSFFKEGWRRRRRGGIRPEQRPPATSTRRAPVTRVPSEPRACPEGGTEGGERLHLLTSLSNFTQHIE